MVEVVHFVELKCYFLGDVTVNDAENRIEITLCEVGQTVGDSCLI
jgi:hypothetical protein